MNKFHIFKLISAELCLNMYYFSIKFSKITSAHLNFRYRWSKVAWFGQLMVF